jgi:hypothetical protein
MSVEAEVRAVSAERDAVLVTNDASGRLGRSSR